jgi:hypothetical protein
MTSPTAHAFATIGNPNDSLENRFIKNMKKTNLSNEQKFHLYKEEIQQSIASAASLFETGK